MAVPGRQDSQVISRSSEVIRQIISCEGPENEACMPRGPGQFAGEQKVMSGYRI